MTGGKSDAVFERRNGRRWLWQAETLWEFPEFDPTDIGRSTTTDGVITRGFIEYRDTQPTRWRRNYAIRATTTNEWNFGWVAQGHSLQPRVLVTWPNFCETQVTLNLAARAQNHSLIRGGPSMEEPKGWRTDLRLQNSTLFLVWQQDRAFEEMRRARASFADMFDSVGQTGDNYVVLKASFWFSPN